MWHRQHRRVDVAASWRHARTQLVALIAERDALKRELVQTQHELASTRQNVHDLRGVVDEMLATRRACEMAEADLRRLYRERAIARARAAGRDPALPLN
jgi:hypothetical protein